MADVAGARPSGSGSTSRSRSQPRSAGNSPIASSPAATSCHRSSGGAHPPGKRQAIPTIAIGSSTARPATWAARRPPAHRSPWPARLGQPAGVGWSKTRLARSRSPVAATSLLRSSTVAGESKPSSLNVRLGSTASVELCPSTTAACARTSSSTALRRSCSGRAAIRAAKSQRAGAAGRLGLVEPARARPASRPPPPAPRSRRPGRCRSSGARAGRRRWAARTRRGSASANAAVQSTSVPRTYASASEVRKRAGPPSSAQQGRDDGRPLELSQDGLRGLLDAVGEHRVGADLDEGPPPLPQESLDRRLEQDRLAQVAEPVLGVHLGGVGGLAGDGRVEGDLAGPRLDPGERGDQLVADRLDLR